jgi:hypothetical protein
MTTDDLVIHVRRQVPIAMTAEDPIEPLQVELFSKERSDDRVLQARLDFPQRNFDWLRDRTAD